MSNQSTSNDAASSSSAPAPADGDTSNTQDQDTAPQGPAPGLYARSLANDNYPDDSISGIVARIMNPPEWLRNNQNQTVFLTINWVVGVAGQERFELLPHQDRYVLRRDDELWEKGEEAGLSAEVMDWLKDGEETLTLPASHFE